MPVIGVPRSLYYFYYYPLWTRFLTDLGFQVVISPPTNEVILRRGLLTCVDGACLPIKAFVGHALTLCEAGVEQLFIPEITSISKGEFVCTGFMGLPDLLRQYLPKDTVLLRPILDGRRGKFALTLDYWRFGLEFAPFGKVRQAWHNAIREQASFEKAPLVHNFDKIQLLILGPRYLIDDSFLNGRLKEQLSKLGAQILTAHNLDDAYSRQINSTQRKPAFWTGTRKSVGAFNYFGGKIDGVINLIPFPCGAQSLFSVLLQQFAVSYNLPVLNLTLDEHTSELGFITRLEAFCDLLERRKSS